MPDGLLIFLASISILPTMWAADRAHAWISGYLLDLEHRHLVDEETEEAW